MEAFQPNINEVENKSQFYTLLTAYIQGDIDRTDVEKLFHAMDELSDEQLHQAIQAILDRPLEEARSEYIQERVAFLHERIMRQVETAQKDNKRHTIGIKRALVGIAATCALFFTVAYFWKETQRNDQQFLTAVDQVKPGTTKATIRIDGREYSLDGSKEGLILSADSLFYTDGTPLSVSKPQHVRISTPYGGQYQLVLADGTKVWMNAGSVLDYSADFGTRDRHIRLEGEAYFEVVRNKQLPFIVEAGHQKVTVLGTAFNINAYPEEKRLQTTLRSGSLKVETPTDQLTLKPNQQTVFDRQRGELRAREVDAESIISWTDGVMDLHGVSLEEGMRIVGRWYDLQVIYANEIPAIQLGGKMSRGVKLSSLLTFLEQNFNIKGEVTTDRKLVIRTIR
ncbi:FecR family protein [Sphingobacterium suaedae]|uniref:FecR family protein n=1 Tax=Sphingobacterium suaedae TaxID=1686402 RepID=A0ABW5KFF9_9SPHI